MLYYLGWRILYTIKIDCYLLKELRRVIYQTFMEGWKSQMPHAFSMTQLVLRVLFLLVDVGVNAYILSN
jgi:hypothetical protein